jgi:hypothetical protein
MPNIRCNAKHATSQILLLQQVVLTLLAPLCALQTPCPSLRLPPTLVHLALRLPLCDLGHHTSKEVTVVCDDENSTLEHLETQPGDLADAQVCAYAHYGLA